MAQGYDITTAADNRHALLGPACRFWHKFVFANHDNETKCGMCRMCVTKDEDWQRFRRQWDAMQKAGL